MPWNGIPPSLFRYMCYVAYTQLGMAAIYCSDDVGGSKLLLLDKGNYFRAVFYRKLDYYRIPVHNTCS